MNHKRWLKITSIVAGSILLLLLLVWAVLFFYVKTHKDKILEKVTEQINDNINGELKIDDVSLAFFKDFPRLSLALENVIVRDSLWQQHQHDLINADYVYVAVNAFSLINQSPKIKLVTIEDATVYMYIDSAGYSNLHVFDKDAPPKDEKNTTPQIRNIDFEDVMVVLDNRTKRKLFRLEFNSLEARTTYNDTGWVAKTTENVWMRDFTFNEEKGSFIKNKRLRANLTLIFNEENQTLYIPKQPIRLDADELSFKAQFYFKNTPPQFSLTFDAIQIPYKNAVSLTSPNIQQKLNLMDLKNPIDLHTQIDGKIKFRDTPIVKVDWVVENNSFITPGGEITDCSFKGFFINSYIPGKGHNDKNSLISVPKFTGRYASIPFNADSVSIINLQMPKLAGHFTSNFQLDQLNNAVGSNTLQFTKGKANVDISYKGGLNANDPTPPNIKGYVSIRDLFFTYIPRDISFTNSEVTLFFAGNNLLVKNTRLQNESTILNVEGTILNFLNLYFTEPEKILLDWKISSPMVNLNEFQSLLHARKKTPKKQKNSNKGLSRISGQLDEVLEKSNVKIKLKVDKLIYKKFTATDILADMQLKEKDILIKNAAIKNSGGRLVMNATVHQYQNRNNVSLDADIQHVDVQKFFKEFNDFGQEAISYENLKGHLTAKIGATTIITDKGEVMPGSMNGKVSFNLEDGELNNFEPFEKIGKFIFKKRNLSHVTFRDIKNTLELKGDKIKINPMYIESSAFTIGVEGIYGLNGGTNIFIDLPLKNPQKNNDIENDSLRIARNMKGLVLRLQALDGADGKVKIKLRSSARKRAKDTVKTIRE